MKNINTMGYNSWSHRISLLLGSSFLLGLASPSFAAEADTTDTAPTASQSTTPASSNGGVTDIVVTASRRETRLQTTPISVGVLSNDLLKNQGLTNFRELSGVVAGLQTSPSTSIIGYAYIRGIGSQLSSFQSPVAVYVDDVMWARQMNNATFNLPDVERVEVLRGPQGTLYGLNSSAGAIRVISRTPDDTLRGQASVSLGNDGLFRASAYVSGPIVEGVLAASIAYSHYENDGYTRNETLGKNVNATRNDQLRLKLHFTPPSIEGFEATASFLTLRDRSDSPAYSPLNVANPKPYVTYDALDPQTKNRAYAGSLNIGYQISDSTKLRSITGYRSFKAQNPWSIGGLATPRFYWQNDPDQRQISQEFQLATDLGKLSLTTGAIYFHEKFRIIRNANSLGAFNGVDSTTVTDSFGIYAEGRYAFSDRFGLTLGGRYYNQRDTFGIAGFNGSYFGERGATTFEVDGLKQKIDGFTPKIGLDFKVSDDLFTYASLTTGVKAGGYWPTSGSAQSATLALRPEKVTTYEAGFKSTAFDKRLQLNVTGFYNDFKDLQTQVGNVVFNGVLVSGSVTLNAQKARTYGVEAELTARPTDRLTAQVNATFLSAKFKDFNVQQTTGVLSFDGNQLPAISPVNVTGRLSYELPVGDAGSFFLRGEVRYLSRNYSTIFNTIRDPAQTYVNLDASFTTKDEAWTVFAIVRNLLDKATIVAHSGTGVPGINSAIYIPPRSVEVGVRYQF